MKRIPFLLLSGFFILPNAVSLAQTPQSPPKQPQRPPDGGTREVLVSILIPSKPNAPFTATVNTEWIRQLPDGSAVTLKNHRAIARDTAGRISKREFWYSPQLGINLISKLQHPLSDTQNFEVSDITLGEPDAKLFEVPSGSRILDLRQPREISSPQTVSPN